MRREYPEPAIAAESLLHKPVFERMKTNHDESPTGAKDFGDSPEADLQPFQFLVDSNPQGLKYPCRRIDSALLPRDNFANDLGKLCRQVNRTTLPSSDNRTGNSPTIGIFSVSIEKLGQPFLRKAID